MKILKLLIALSLVFSLIGCHQRNQSSASNKDTDTETLKEIPEYKYPDNFFNNNFTKDNQGNRYFQAGMYVYQYDNQNNLKQLFYRLIDDKYYIYHARYENNKFFLLILKINHKYNDGPLAIATINSDGSNFQILSNLTYAETYLPATISNFRIHNNQIYLIDNITPSVYIYSLESQSVIDKQTININESRYQFYKDAFTDYPYDEIQHIYDGCFYQIVNSENNQKKYIKYDPIQNIEEQFDIDSYYNHNSNKLIEFYVDLIDDNWYLFSNKGVFQFDSNFDNETQLLNESIFNDSHTFTYKDNEIIMK